MSFDPNDWTQTPQDNASSYGQHEAGYHLPTARPQGSDLPLEQIQLQNDEVAMNVTAGALQESFEYVKKHPAETLAMSFLTLLFGGSFNGNIPTGNFGGGGSDYDYDTYDSSSDAYDPGTTDYDYGSWFDGSDLLGVFSPEGLFSMNSPLLGQADLFGLGLGAAAIAAIVAVGLVFLVFYLCLTLLMKFGTTSLWLRIIRGQDTTLGASFGGASRFVVPLALTLILKMLGIFAGFLCCIVPWIILSYGWYFVHFMVIDKNISYSDALTASWRLTDGHKLDLFVFSIIAVLLNVAGFFMCCVGIIATNAVVLGGVAVIYNRLAAPGNAYLQPHESSGTGVVNVFE